VNKGKKASACHLLQLHHAVLDVALRDAALTTVHVGEPAVLSPMLLLELRLRLGGRLRLCREAVNLRLLLLEETGDYEVQLPSQAPLRVAARLLHKRLTSSRGAHS